ncbi:MAG: glycosyltransferase family 2 protein [Candidatus Saccharimonadales bacterium]
MREPTVAVVVRTKNRPLLLERAIKSVLEQTYKDFQLVIVNDGGDPAPIENLIKKHAKDIAGRVKLQNNKASVGHGAACNVGLESSDSKYIVMLDDDDTWHKDFLETTIGYVDANTDCFGVVTASEVVYETIENDKVSFVKRESFLPEIKSINLFSMLGGNQFPNLAFLYRRSALKKVGKYAASASPLEDWDFNIRFLKHYDIHFIDKPLVYYHQRAEQTGELGNSIFVPDFHSGQYNRLLNKYLREDLDKGVLGAGFIANIVHQMLKARASDLTFLNSLIRQSTTETHNGINTLHQKIDSIDGRTRNIESKLMSMAVIKARRYARRAIKKLKPGRS